MYHEELQKSFDNKTRKRELSHHVDVRGTFEKQENFRKIFFKYTKVNYIIHIIMNINSLLISPALVSTKHGNRIFLIFILDRSIIGKNLL